MKGKTGKIPQPGDPQGKMDKNPTPKDVYAGGESNVLKEAKKRKRGGKVDEKRECRATGGAAAARGDRAPRKRGGRANGGVMSAAHGLTAREGSKGMAPAND